jgi:hypothetical protein
MNTVTLQVSMAQTLKTKASKVAQDLGFSSLQEVVRVLLSEFSRGKIVPSWTSSGLISPQKESVGEV